MNIYNITFIVEKEIEKEWIEYVDREILPNLASNVHQVQFYCKDQEMIRWVKEIGHQMLLQKLHRKFTKNWLAFASTLEFIKSY